MEFEVRSANGIPARTVIRNVTAYNRLVRDKIPEIIEAMGNIAVWRELDDDDFGQAVLDTMARASSQFAESESLEALADVLEAMDAWLELRGLTMEDVERARQERRKRCGGFERRRFLQTVAGAAAVDELPRKDSSC
ncbi:MAG: nucleoside triphosphate pyrophosphohydrolase [Alicyclobacillus sp.]|nr:nucleoside triphosphate pyrophosphohydrolase [Alicyclobacillus sp.]